MLGLLVSSTDCGVLSPIGLRILSMDILSSCDDSGDDMLRSYGGCRESASFIHDEPS